MINHNTWYAHMFRTQGGDFGFPYPLSGAAVSHAKNTAKELFFNGNWSLQKRPLSWLVERFWPVPGWTQDDLDKLKGIQPTTSQSPTPEKPFINMAEVEQPEEQLSGQIALPIISSMTPTTSSATPTVGCIYYTDNQLDENIMRVCQKQLLKATKGKKLVSVSLKPMDFGENIVLPLERGYLTMFKQILTALEAIDTDVVYFCEHDVLYHPSHFDFIPPKNDIFYYDNNYWFLRMTDGFALHYDVSPLSSLCAYREPLIKHYRERIALVEKEGFSYRIGFEPMTHHRIKWENWYGFELRKSESPSIDICHGGNVTRKRWTKDLFRRQPTDWQEGDIDHIPGWDNVRRLLKFQSPTK